MRPHGNFRAVSFRVGGYSRVSRFESGSLLEVIIYNIKNRTMNITSLIMNKQVLLALGMIVFVGAVVAGGTGAFFSSQATATGNVFAAGTLDLAITRDEQGSNPETSKDAEWSFSNMAPGGTPVEESVWLRNVGSIDGESIAVGADFSGQGPIAQQMRITTLTWDGENILEGGAGANLDDYEPVGDPEIRCDIQVRFGNNDYDTISEAADNAAANDLICVAAGDYTQSWESTNGSGYPIDVNASGVEIVSLDGPSATTIRGQVNLNANDTAVRGFTLATDGERYGIKLAAGLSGVEITFNEFDGTNAFTPGGDTMAIEARLNGYTDLLVNNNYIHDFNRAVWVLGSTNTVLEYNTFGVSGDGTHLDNAINGIIRFNVYTKENPASIGAAIPSNVSVGDTLTVEFNDFSDYSPGAAISQYGDSTITAENNWWGDFDPSDQVNQNSGVVDFEPFLGGPINGFVNGVDANGNGYADLHDLRAADITDILPGLESWNGSNDKEFVMAVQLDASTGNTFQGESLNDVTIEFTLNQI